MFMKSKCQGHKHICTLSTHWIFVLEVDPKEPHFNETISNSLSQKSKRQSPLKDHIKDKNFTLRNMKQYFLNSFLPSNKNWLKSRA